MSWLGKVGVCVATPILEDAVRFAPISICFLSIAKMILWRVVVESICEKKDF